MPGLKPADMRLELQAEKCSAAEPLEALMATGNLASAKMTSPGLTPSGPSRVGEVTFESNLVTSYKLLAPCNWKFRYIAVTSSFNLQRTNSVKFLSFDDRNLLITSGEMRQQA